MKEGRLSSVRWWSRSTSLSVRVSSLAHLSMAPLPAIGWVGAAPVAQFSSGPSCGQGHRGACRSKGFVGRQHVPDRLGQTAADLDRSQLRPPLAAVAGEETLVDGPVTGMAVGGMGRFDERPAQVAGAVLAQAPAPVALARLLDLRAQARVADQLARAREAADLADLGGDREGEHPADSRAGHEQRDVPVLGAEPAQLALAGRDLLVE